MVGWVPPSLPPLHKRPPPLIIASKCPCPYANRISEAFCIDFVNKYRCFYGQQQNRQFYSINLCCCGQQQNHQF